MKDSNASPPLAEIVSIGDELVLGEIADTNAAEIAWTLAGEGMMVVRVTVVGDERGRIVTALSEAISRADAVIVTGGLGPTEDDLTRHALADALGVPLEHSAEAERAVAERTGRDPTNMDLRQALVPRGAEVIPNPRGTAPGLRARRDGTVVYVLPGVPHEMRGMLRESVLPRLRQDVGVGLLAKGFLVTFGMREADIASRLSGVEAVFPGVRIGTRAQSGVVTVRVSSVQGRADEALDEVRNRLGEAVVGEGDATLAELVAAEALGRGLRIAVAESLTGGGVTSRLVAVPGMSQALVEGIVAYANEAKVRRLGASAELIEKHGAVSAEVARAMAEGALLAAGADVAVSTTGVAGPTGGSEAKPVGLVFMAAAGAAGTEVVERRFRGERGVVIERAAETALWLLLRAVRSTPGPGRGAPATSGPAAGGRCPAS